MQASIVACACSRARHPTGSSLNSIVRRQHPVAGFAGGVWQRTCRVGRSWALQHKRPSARSWHHRAPMKQTTPISQLPEQLDTSASCGGDRPCSVAVVVLPLGHAAGPCGRAEERLQRSQRSAARPLDAPAVRRCAPCRCAVLSALRQCSVVPTARSVHNGQLWHHLAMSGLLAAPARCNLWDAAAVTKMFHAPVTVSMATGPYRRAL